MASSKQQLHVVAVPLPAQGHINPLMRLCKLLALQGVLVTFVNIDPVHNRIEELAMQREAEEEEEEEAAAAAVKLSDDHTRKGMIRRTHVPVHGFDLANDFHVSLETLYEAQKSIASPLEALILDLNRQGPPVTCLISDFSITFPTQEVADKLNIPRVVFVAFSASGLLSVHYLVQGDHISMQEVMARLSRRASKREVLCEGLLGLPTIYNDEAFYFKHVMDDNAYMWEAMKKRCEKSFSHAHALVINSFKELEESALTTLSNQFKFQVYGVGPLVELLNKDSSTSLWKESEHCLHWLDQQPHLSVLYISFGSVTLLTQTQFEELVTGLVNSKQHFLWVFRPNLVENVSPSNVFEDILSRSQGKGYIIDWAPQLQVLLHPSVGGFLTHCGWNSSIEAISVGVPMLCWPYFADQFLNAKYLVEEWRVGLKFETSKNKTSLIESCEVERVIKILMEGEEGKSLRKNAMHLREAGYKGRLPGGISNQNIKCLLKSFL